MPAGIASACASINERFIGAVEILNCSHSRLPEGLSFAYSVVPSGKMTS
jgi:hypothetical protein